VKTQDVPEFEPSYSGGEL